MCIRQETVRSWIHHALATCGVKASDKAARAAAVAALLHMQGLGTACDTGIRIQWYECMRVPGKSAKLRKRRARNRTGSVVPSSRVRTNVVPTVPKRSKRSVTGRSRGCKAFGALGPGAIAATSMFSGRKRRCSGRFNTCAQEQRINAKPWPLNVPQT